MENRARNDCGTLFKAMNKEEREGLVKVRDFKEVKTWGDCPQKLRTKQAETLRGETEDGLTNAQRREGRRGNQSACAKSLRSCLAPSRLEGLRLLYGLETSLSTSLQTPQEA